MKTVALALQGGGAHGAFVWGVLDRLCQERHLKISAISGASSGAFNAAVYLYGLASGGAKGAREALEDFWTNVAKQALWSGNPFIGASFFGAFRNIDNHPLPIWIEQLAPIIPPYNLPFLQFPRTCGAGRYEGSGETKAPRAGSVLRPCRCREWSPRNRDAAKHYHSFASRIRLPAYKLQSHTDWQGPLLGGWLYGQSRLGVARPPSARQ